MRLEYAENARAYVDSKDIKTLSLLANGKILRTFTKLSNSAFMWIWTLCSYNLK